MQSVDYKTFERSTPDFDINSLCVRQGVIFPLTDTVRVDMGRIIAKILRKEGKQLKSDTEPRMVQRRDRLERRGWRITHEG